MQRRGSRGGTNSAGTELLWWGTAKQRWPKRGVAMGAQGRGMEAPQGTPDFFIVGSTEALVLVREKSHVAT
jgi:hypothetical protein